MGVFGFMVNGYINMYFVYWLHQLALLFEGKNKLVWTEANQAWDAYVFGSKYAMFTIQRLMGNLQYVCACIYAYGGVLSATNG